MVWQRSWNIWQRIVTEGTVTYSQVEAVLKDLYDVGFYPAKLAVTTVLHAFADEKTP